MTLTRNKCCRSENYILHSLFEEGTVGEVQEKISK